MPLINPCLKRSFTVFNVLFAIVGGLIIALALLSQVLQSSHGVQEYEGRTAGLIMLYVMGSVTMVIAILGAYGAHKESRGALIAFLVCMVIGSLLMLRVGVPMAAARPELEGVLERKLQLYVPLSDAPAEVKDMADMFQETFHCCGLFSYTDWRNEIPDSCLCNPQEMEGTCRSVQVLFQSKSVWTQTCFPIIWHYVGLVTDIMLGVVFALAILALLGMVLSSVMIHQMRVVSRPVMVLTVPAIFTPQPPKYQELHNSHY